MAQKRGPKGGSKKDIRVSNLQQSRIRKARLQLMNAENQYTVLLPKRIEKLKVKLKRLEEVAKAA